MTTAKLSQEFITKNNYFEKITWKWPSKNNLTKITTKNWILITTTKKLTPVTTKNDHQNICTKNDHQYRFYSVILTYLGLKTKFSNLRACSWIFLSNIGIYKNFYILRMKNIKIIINIHFLVVIFVWLFFDGHSSSCDHFAVVNF